MHLKGAGGSCSRKAWSFCRDWTHVIVDHVIKMLIVCKI
jgi:hypothetical protein